MFNATDKKVIYVARSDADNPLASFSRHGFELDGESWPSVEHYYHGMKFEDGEVRESIRSTPHPSDTAKLAKKHRRHIRKDWNKIRVTVMTRAIYIKCRSHPEVAAALQATGELRIVETSQYDYFWGCGRDARGDNRYGEVLMNVRNKLREEASASET
ncbi:GTP cyclohydrolase [Solemya pervernicosa gill symbiont]|uniref:GTP cyclohydrolase n=2 Tax=Gammaproteobacteria incertae sedis TaxID=118884 RepID=A0A1T2L0Z4_9GAMM|nr:NADAR family protein [Candidatus Reidiella endopervernicosa]OOZ38680.1 GTP cyclohydrolase [Solemya pervernicosa gill symbiont]QKQ25191.1 NADAR family protein [Candidatus Reidiella endopervernicosa]